MGERGKHGRGRAIFNICQAVIGFMIRTKSLFYSLFHEKKSHFNFFMEIRQKAEWVL